MKLLYGRTGAEVILLFFTVLMSKNGGIDMEMKNHCFQSILSFILLLFLLVLYVHIARTGRLRVIQPEIMKKVKCECQR